LYRFPGCSSKAANGTMAMPLEQVKRLQSNHQGHHCRLTAALWLLGGGAQSLIHPVHLRTLPPPPDGGYRGISQAASRRRGRGVRGYSFYGAPAQIHTEPEENVHIPPPWLIAVGFFMLCTMQCSCFGVHTEVSHLFWEVFFAQGKVGTKKILVHRGWGVVRRKGHIFSCRTTTNRKEV
jgi:hypothetical protein